MPLSQQGLDHRSLCCLNHFELHLSYHMQNGCRCVHPISYLSNLYIFGGGGAGGGSTFSWVRIKYPVCKRAILAALSGNTCRHFPCTHICKPCLPAWLRRSVAIDDSGSLENPRWEYMQRDWLSWPPAYAVSTFRCYTAVENEESFRTRLCLSEGPIPVWYSLNSQL